MIVETIIGLGVLAGAAYVIYNMLNQKEESKTAATLRPATATVSAAKPKTTSTKAKAPAKAKATATAKAKAPAKDKKPKAASKA